MKEPIHVSDESYQKAVLESPIPVIVDFWAPWCGPCKMISPALDQLAAEFEGRLLVAKINIDEDTETAGAYDVQSIPTLLFVKNGEVVDRHSGSIPAAALRGMAESLLS